MEERENSKMKVCKECENLVMQVSKKLPKAHNLIKKMNKSIECDECEDAPSCSLHREVKSK